MKLTKEKVIKALKESQEVRTSLRKAALKLGCSHEWLRQWCIKNNIAY